MAPKSFIIMKIIMMYVIFVIMYLLPVPQRIYNKNDGHLRGRICKLTRTQNGYLHLQHDFTPKTMKRIEPHGYLRKVIM